MSVDIIPVVILKLHLSPVHANFDVYFELEKQIWSFLERMSKYKKTAGTYPGKDHLYPLDEFAYVADLKRSYKAREMKQLMHYEVSRIS